MVCVGLPPGAGCCQLLVTAPPTALQRLCRVRFHGRGTWKCSKRKQQGLCVQRWTSFAHPQNNRDMHQAGMNMIRMSIIAGSLVVLASFATGSFGAQTAEPLLNKAKQSTEGSTDVAPVSPSDLQGMMKAVLRQQAEVDAHLATSRMPLYVSIRAPAGDSMIDLSPESILALEQTGFLLLPGSAWQPPSADTRVGTAMRLSMGAPVMRPDGDYDAAFEYWCGTACSSRYDAVLRHDTSGWQVLSSVMSSIP